MSAANRYDRPGFAGKADSTEPVIPLSVGIPLPASTRLPAPAA